VWEDEAKKDFPLRYKTYKEPSVPKGTAQTLKKEGLLLREEDVASDRKRNL